MKYFLTAGDQEFEIKLTETEDGAFSVVLNGRELSAHLERIPGDDLWSLLLDTKSFDLLVNENNGHTTVVHHGLSVDVLVESERERNARLIAADLPSSGGGVLRAVMPGIVAAVHVKAGDQVKKGEALVVLEAMKMENEIRTSISGLVSKVNVAKGKTVNAGDVLIEIAPEGT